MTRPKVPDDKRQRTAQACDICKRRKQKCNGKTPCNTCVKRHLSCEYTTNQSSDSSSNNTAGSPAKRRHIEDAPQLQGVSVAATQPPALMLASTGTLPNSGPLVPPLKTQNHGFDDAGPAPRAGPAFARDARPKQHTAAEPDEEAEVYGQTRMLQDPTGRLLYVGDSATLSYLQLIRMIVDSAAGTSQFTSDPNRHMIQEATVTIPSNIRIPPMLPDRETATVLVNAYFTNTQGLIEVFDRRAFTQNLEALYLNPLSGDTPFLCLLYLTLAIGLVFATPIPNSPEDAIVKRLRADPVDRAEIFFRGARCLGDPVSGFEDADFWSVQALCLMSVYMLAVAKRQAAYAYYGMAVRSGFALGLHRIGDTTLIFSSHQVMVRRNLWRSLFVLDRFLAASLGRPTAISEEDCSADALDSPKPAAQDAMGTTQDSLSSKGLDAAVKTCQSIGRILKKVYSRRKISSKLAQDIAGQCEMWTRRIHPNLDPSNLFNGTITSAQGMAILHVQLFSCHSIILLTRPFFLYLLIKAQKEKGVSSRQHQKAPNKPPSRLERFAEACVAAATQTVALVQTAYQSNYLPQRNPFVVYFLFAATLIILSNEFARLYKNRHYAESVRNAINVIRYCAATDAQAHRLLYILTTFHSVVEEQAAPSVEAIQRTRSMHMDMFEGSTADPLSHLATTTQQQSLVEQQEKKAASSHAQGPGPQAIVPPTSSLALATTPNTSMPGLTVSTSLLDDTRTVGMSPASSRTASSQSRSVRYTTDGEKADSLGGEQEFDFDSFWDFQPSLAAAAAAAGPVPDAQAPGAVLQHQPPSAAAAGQGFAHFVGFTTSPGSHGQASAMMDGNGVPMLGAVDYQI